MSLRSSCSGPWSRLLLAEFLVDRSLGGVQVPEAVRGLGHHVRTLASEWGETAAQILADEVWLEESGRREWFVLTGDSNIRKLPAFWANPVAVFSLPNNNMTGPQQVVRFIDRMADMLHVAKVTPRPFMAVVYAEEVVARAGGT